MYGLTGADAGYDVQDRSPWLMVQRRSSVPKDPNWYLIGERKPILLVEDDDAVPALIELLRGARPTPFWRRTELTRLSKWRDGPQSIH